MICDKLSEYFKSPDLLVNYDYNYCKTKAIKDLMKKEFERYSDFIKNSAELCVYKDEISMICKQLVEIIKKYEGGYIQDSIKIMEQLMAMVRKKGFLKEITIQMAATTMDTPKNFYRMRISDEYIYKRCEIFHIPLSKRRTVRTQRYSIPGFPCLYLSSSVYTCWEELGKPPLDKTYISKFSLQENISMLDIRSIDPKRLFYYDRIDLYTDSEKMYIKSISEKKQIAAVVLWPLAFSCSLYGSSTNDIYRPEYIIPQLLLQWVRKSNLDGIAYLTIRANTESIDPYYCVNYTFPVKKFHKDFCSNLSKKFKLTSAFRCDELNDVMRGHQYTGSSTTWNRRFLIDEIKYENTTYGIIETNLFWIEGDFVDK
jgi:hypothetical protein